MERKLMSILRLQLKIAALGIALCLAGIFAVSFTAGKVYNDVWQQLGMTEKQGAMQIEQSFLSGYLTHYGARNLKNIALSDRAAIAKDLLQYTKKHVQTEAFKAAYSRERMARKPREPRKPETEESIRAKQVKETRRGISELETAMKNPQFDEKTKKTFQDLLEQQQKKLKDLESPNSEAIKQNMQYQKTVYDNQMESYQEKLATWEQNWPESPQQLIRQRLQQVLENTEGVDYKAELTERNGFKYFVNPAYEKKSKDWKAAYRAGKEVTETVRSFVQQWLKEMGNA